MYEIKFIWKTYMYKSISWICLYHPGSISNAVYLNLTNVFSQLSLCAMTQIYTGYGFRRARTEIALRDKLFATHTHTHALSFVRVGQKIGLLSKYHKTFAHKSLSPVSIFSHFHIIELPYSHHFMWEERNF